MTKNSMPLASHPKRLFHRRAALIAWVAILTVAGVVAVVSLRDDSASPRYPLAVGLGLLAGVGLGVAIAYVWDRRTGRLKKLSDVAAATELPVLGTIPSVRKTHPDPAEVVDAYGDLAARLAGTIRESGANCLLITSPTRKAGRGIVAVNLSASLAANGMKVALIHADSHGGPQPGLTEVLDGTSTLGAALQANEHGRLTVLTAGAPSGRRVVGHDLDDFAGLLDRLTKSVDLVVIDAPPVLGTLETVLLAQEVDLVLLAVDTRHDTRSDTSTAVSCLAHVEDQLIGCVAEGPGQRRHLVGAALGGPLSAVRLRSPERRRWAGVLATVAAVAMVITSVWWLSDDGRSEARQNSDRTVPPLASIEGSAQPAIDAATEECRSTSDAQAEPLRAAATSLSQWQTHITAMNQLVAGEITLDQANRFWERTRVGAGRKVQRFHDADSTYTNGDHSCNAMVTGRDADADTAALSACQRDIAQRDDALSAARVAIETWHHHVMDMNLMRAGKLSPTRAVRLWNKYWMQGADELKQYRTQLRQASSESC